VACAWSRSGGDPHGPARGMARPLVEREGRRVVANGRMFLVSVIYNYRNTESKKLSRLGNTKTTVFACVFQFSACLRSRLSSPAIFLISGDGRRRSGDNKWYQSQVPAVDT